MTPGTLRIGTYFVNPPFEYVADGQRIGFEVDLMNEIAGRLSLSPAFVDTQWETILQEMQEGQIIVVQTKDFWYVYTVTVNEVVTPHSVEVVAPTPDQIGVAPKKAMMTLTTCNPKWNDYQRMAVRLDQQNVPEDDPIRQDLLMARDAVEELCERLRHLGESGNAGAKNKTPSKSRPEQNLPINAQDNLAIFMAAQTNRMSIN